MLKTSAAVLRLSCAVGLLWLPFAQGADAYYHLPTSALTLTEGAWPSGARDGEWRDWRTASALRSYAVLDGLGEAYVDGEAAIPWADEASEPMSLAICAPAGQDVSGRLFVRRDNLQGLAPLRFKVPATAAQPEARERFLAAKQAHYRALQDRGLPGAAWFRHQAAAAARERGVDPAAETEPRWFPGRNPASSLEDTYDLFTGGRALSENLQLERALPPLGTRSDLVPLSSIPGITVREMDWKALLDGTATPALDPLAAALPADQHALFFPSFEAMIRMMDEAETNGTPVLQWLEPRAEDTNVRGRYQRQLCLGLTEFSRVLGPFVIRSVAFTGSDPFLRVGTDVAVLFEAKNPALLRTHILAQQQAARAANAAVEAVSGELAGTEFAGVVAADRSISSYVASLTNVVVVSNSRRQLEHLIRTAQGQTPALAALDEYRYFRQRYLRGEAGETAFLVLTDATIRRWCGPEWRIADSRRTRAAAVMADLQATHFEALVKGAAAETALTSAFPLPDAGELRLTRTGVRSATYGTLDFMTPIAELALANVTKAEAEAYAVWRDNYQRNWQQFFDPIAIRFSVAPARLGAEMTVMPLIAATDYRWFLDTTLGARMEPTAGDPHTNALVRLGLALNPKSERMKDASSFLVNLAPGLKANPLGWLGSALTLYADDDPFWNELLASTNAGEVLEDRYAQLPVALHFEVKNSLGVVAFLAGVRAYIEQTAPQMTVWANREHLGRAYVKVSASVLSNDPEHPWAVYYAVTPGALTVSLNEPLIQRALERQPTNAAPAQPALPAERLWLGGNLGFTAERRFLEVVEAVGRRELESSRQLLAWGNLPILNEWKRRFPDQDPVGLHESWWGTKLLCPGGGAYVWNPEWQTVESTVFGHPGAPKSAPGNPFADVTFVNLGVTFEHQGLSARAFLEREAVAR
jgi:hypothetical protein